MHPRCYVIRCGENLALPESQDKPTCGRELACAFSIALNVPFDLRDPIRSVVTGDEPAHALLEVTTVPEITVAKDRNALTPKDNIRTAYQVYGVEPVAKPEAGERAAE